MTITNKELFVCLITLLPTFFSFQDILAYPKLNDRNRAGNRDMRGLRKGVTMRGRVTVRLLSWRMQPAVYPKRKRTSSQRVDGKRKKLNQKHCPSP